jgi:hypothetical protein
VASSAANPIRIASATTIVVSSLNLSAPDEGSLNEKAQPLSAGRDIFFSTGIINAKSQTYEIAQKLGLIRG